MTFCASCRKARTRRCALRLPYTLGDQEPEQLRDGEAYVTSGRLRPSSLSTPSELDCLSCSAAATGPELIRRFETVKAESTRNK